ncbi:MAG TPA: MBL fold metallo-hydrolase, partial [Candidatus Didemnitutus sp.]|nr:MBL fold metallo-hydrolase [Candidatus Didemnitutus sp.]
NQTFRPVAKHIVAHQNVPKLQAAAAERNPKQGPPVFPDVTFAESWRLDAGDEVVTGHYFGAAHTGGDIVVHFEKANVAHVGDLVFNRIYPVTDRPGGSSVRGWIKVLDSIAKTYPADTQFIFGHGKASFGITGTHADVAVQRDLLSALVEHVQKEMKAGKPREEIVKLTNRPGWPDHFTEQNSRLPGNLGAVFDELSGT